MIRHRARNRAMFTEVDSWSAVVAMTPGADDQVGVTHDEH